MPPYYHARRELLVRCGPPPVFKVRGYPTILLTCGFDEFLRTTSQKKEIGHFVSKIAALM